MIFVNKLNLTGNNKKIQEVSKSWLENIEKIIPVDLDQSAKDYGALIRKRGVKNASDLLKILMIYATGKISVRILSVAASALKISDISDTAWNKRISLSAAWLAFLLDSVLSSIVNPSEEKLSKNRNVYLIDSTYFRQEGKTRKLYRAHINYCLNTGCMHEIKVTDIHTAESLTVYEIMENGIYIADAGYGKATQIAYALSKSADVLFRMTPNQVALYDKDGEKLNTSSILKTKKSTIDLHCFIKHNKILIPVRIIASRLPEDKIEAAIKHKKRQSQRMQTKLKPETLIYAEWVILVTSLDTSFSPTEILSIYRSRWQIELLFKRIKQNLMIHLIRAASPKYALAIIELWLLIWAISERQLLIFQNILLFKNLDPQRFSIWALSQLTFIQTLLIIECQWSSLINEYNFASFANFLLNHKSSRINQYASLTLCTFSSNLS